MMMMNSTLIWSPALAPVQSPAILPLISLPRQDLSQVKQVHVFTVNDTESDWSVTLEMNGSDVTFKIDTGAQCNVIPKHLLQKFSPKPKIKPATIKLSAYNGTSIPVSGKCIGKLKLKDRTVNVLFIVVDSDSVPILGLNTSVKLNLIKQTYERPVHSPNSRGVLRLFW